MSRRFFIGEIVLQLIVIAVFIYIIKYHYNKNYRTISSTI